MAMDSAFEKGSQPFTHGMRIQKTNLELERLR